MSVEIILSPLTEQGPGLLDAMEARTGKLPFVVNVNDGTRRYHLPEDDATTDSFDTTLDKIDPGWRDHLSRTE